MAENSEYTAEYAESAEQDPVSPCVRGGKKHFMLRGLVYKGVSKG
jgi:hypothetical protein